jgi:hypothetical protein
MLSTEICSICIEEIMIKTETTLRCNHLFHTECLVKYLIYMYNKNCKDNIYLDYDNYKCPICRKHLRCKDIHKIVSTFYFNTQNEYKLYKEQYSKLRYEYYFNSIKYNIKKLFTKNMDSKAYNDYVDNIIEHYNTLLEKETRFKIAEDLYNSIHYCSCLE